MLRITRIFLPQLKGGGIPPPAFFIPAGIRKGRTAARPNGPACFAPFILPRAASVPELLSSF
ncbi:hypothetical protein CE91St46_24600 [Eubacteriales bacterium]|nr:hypothetical protein CE91St46_24600 [Eubacteriales bacterium]GKH64068.1 hypothetical protein CE91St47_25370 [Eubacteriales bacterium]